MDIISNLKKATIYENEPNKTLEKKLPEGLSLMGIKYSTSAEPIKIKEKVIVNESGLERYIIELKINNEDVMLLFEANTPVLFKSTQEN